MKLATYETDGAESFGVVTETGIADVSTAWPDGPPTLLEALRAGPEALAKIAELAASAERRIPLARVSLRAPIPEPPKLIGLAVNYEAHHRESSGGGRLPTDPKRTTTPRPFLMPATAVAAPGAEIPWPVYSRDIDHEVELAAVIGARAQCVGPSEAAECIAGYTIANDVSARTVTHAEGRSQRPKDAFFDWLHGKWADAFCPLGPWLVTPDEVGDPQDLHLELAVNGEIRQSASTAEMIFTVCELVSFLSRLMTLVPGDVIATGTPSGVGMATGKLLRGGDTITCRIEKIGELTHTLGRPPEAFYTPCAG
jgi:2-keto-4-pentenoate hydratase/2-oxohepta-3-ene-1,7-dioic acid hydratase in catechol pathway